MIKKLLLFLFLISNIIFAKTASWYGKKFDGKLTASGYVYSSKELVCASNKYPFGTVLKVTNKENKKFVIVVVIDRGVFDKKYGREIDLSERAFKEIANKNEGLIKVDIKEISKKHIFKYKHGKPKFDSKEYKKFLK